MAEKRHALHPRAPSREEMRLNAKARQDEVRDYLESMTRRRITELGQQHRTAASSIALSDAIGRLQLNHSVASQASVRDLSQLECEAEALKKKREEAKRKWLELDEEHNLQAPSFLGEGGASDASDASDDGSDESSDTSSNGVIDLMVIDDDEAEESPAEELETPADWEKRRRLAFIRQQVEDQRKGFKAWSLDHPLHAADDFASLQASLMRPLTSEEEELYREAMTGDPEEVLFKRYNADMKREHFRCLLPQTWLNDEVINQYLALLRKRSLDRETLPKCYFHLTHMYSQLTQCGYDYSRVKNWTKRGTRKCDIFEMDMVFFPRNIGNSHWAMCVAFMKEHRIEYYDSMGGRGTDCMEHVRSYLADEFEAKKGGDLDADAWVLESKSSSCPQQDNCNDCGVFLSQFCNFISTGCEPCFEAADMPYFRRRMAVDLMNGEACLEQVQD